MNNSPDTTAIPATLPEYTGLDFNLLRQEGIRRLQQLSGKIWTDHNLHDPGITILDQLCYALTDLSYRIDYDIKDLLAGKEGDPYASLYSPAQIMTTNPVTLLDLRKVVIDVKGVRNAWIEKVTLPDPAIFLNPDKRLTLTNPDETAVPLTIKGLYRVLIDTDGSEQKDVQPAVKKRLLASRNVCEDFAEITVLDSQSIAVRGTIEIGNVEDINRFAATLLARLYRFVSPDITFYTLQEMLDKGKRIDEIADGPLLDHGFIEDEELLRYGRQTELHTSDFIREIMDVPGVAGVHDIHLISAGEKAEWRLVLDPQKIPKINVTDCLAELKFTKNGFDLQVNPTLTKKYFDELVQRRSDGALPTAQRDIVTSKGEYRAIDTYHSIQNQFPRNYGIGESGLPESATVRRRVQADQLKGYLLFFDQLLANYFAQVAHLKDLFSFETTDPATYFSQSVLESVPGGEALLDFEDAGNYREWLSETTESDDTALDRKNRYLNHLMARFNESFTQYSLLVYSNTAEKQAGAGPKTQLIDEKVRFLKEYPAISVGRYKSFDYTQPGRSVDPSNISGLEKRIAMRLGISNPANVRLAELTGEANDPGEGFYMLEHVLLRPVKEDYTAYLDFFVSWPITAFEDAGNGNVICYSAGHRLQNGDQVMINGTKAGKKPRYDGTYAIEKVLTDSFQIKVAYDASVKNEDIAAGTLSPAWIVPHVDTTFMILTRPVSKFSKGSTDAYTKCQLPDHGLVNGEMIEIIGPAVSEQQPYTYAGNYAVNVIDASTIEIEHAFAGNDANGRWISLNQKKDPYSLQLTFVFPDWLPRFRDAVFRSFIEQTIREEVPVHLTLYIRWMSREEMEPFENAYDVFLQQLSMN